MPLPEVSPEVRAFASIQGVSAFVTPVLRLAREIFPTAPIDVQIEKDPEIGDYRHIVIAVDVTGWSVPEVVSADNKWTEALLRTCPPPHSLVFCLELR
jgi:hypothetical protein